MLIIKVYRGKTLIKIEEFTEWNDEADTFFDKMCNQGFIVDAKFQKKTSKKK